MKDLSWDDLHAFLLVAEAGGLSGAARQSGLSAPTLGRRMLALEQALGQDLFHRAQTGYTLTPRGTALLERVRAMQAAARPIERQRADPHDKPMIRLTAGTATTVFLADRIAELSRPDDPFRLHFVTTEAVLDIAHREVDLGIRNRPPSSGNLASRPLGQLRFAPYRSHSLTPDQVRGWVAMAPDAARHPAAHWLHAQDLPITVMASSAATVHELLRAGAGVGVLPCLAGDRDPALTRAGPLIEALDETQHLVFHADDRHHPPLRQVISRLVAVYRANADLLAGRRPLRA